MREYPKTDNLFKRNPSNKSELILGKYTRPEFSIVSAWDVTEKVDGTNVRLWFTSAGHVAYAGRTNDATFSQVQHKFLSDLVASLTKKVHAKMAEFELMQLVIFGELYGPRIQSGGNYSDELGFKAFDMQVNDYTWLAPDSVRANCDEFGLDAVPSLGVMFTEDIVEMVIDGFPSTFARNVDYIAEGVIAKPLYNLYDQRGERVMFKLKHKDVRKK